MARSDRRRIWSVSDITPGAPFNREIQTFTKEGRRPTSGSVFAGGGEGGGAPDGARRDATEGDIFGRKPTTER